MVKAQTKAMQRLTGAFADLLMYPSEETRSASVLASEVLQRTSEDALKEFDGFHRFVDEATLPQLEEAYTSTFDLQPKCCPYVGYHLFGESYKRGAFLASLREEYRKRDFSVGSELPDHLAIVLRFLSVYEDELSGELLSECLLPSLEKMISAFDSNGNPYANLLKALLLGIRNCLSSSKGDGQSPDQQINTVPGVAENV